jgi:hypothetical protein
LIQLFKQLRKKLSSLFVAKYAVYLNALLPYSLYVKLLVRTLHVDGNKFSSNRVLCFSRGLFEKDYEQLSYRLRDYGWIWFDKRLFTVCLSHSIPKYARGQKKYASYLEDPGVDWATVTTRAQAFVSQLKNRHGMSCFVTANIDYYQDHALKIACKREGIRVIVLQKEFPVTTKVAEQFTSYYEGWDPNADIVAVAGNRAKKCLEAAGVGKHSQIIVTGLPRLDRYKAIEFRPSCSKEKQRILLLSFRSGYGYDSEQPFFDTAHAIIQLSDEQLEVMIKAKNKNDENVIRDWLMKNMAKKNIEHVSISSSIPLYDAFAFADVVVGYRSLSTVEALLTPLPILMPRYLSASDDDKILSDLDCKKAGVDLYDSIADLQRIIQEKRGGQATFPSDQLMDARQEVFSEYWAWARSETACGRFNAVLSSLLGDR